jgi:hypothetical protein
VPVNAGAAINTNTNGQRVASLATVEIAGICAPRNVKPTKGGLGVRGRDNASQERRTAKAGAPCAYMALTCLAVVRGCQ